MISTKNLKKFGKELALSGKSFIAIMALTTCCNKLSQLLHMFGNKHEYIPAGIPLFKSVAVKVQLFNFIKTLAFKHFRLKMKTKCKWSFKKKIKVDFLKLFKEIIFIYNENLQPVWISEQQLIAPLKAFLSGKPNDSHDRPHCSGERVHEAPDAAGVRILHVHAPGLPLHDHAGHTGRPLHVHDGLPVNPHQSTAGPARHDLLVRDPLVDSEVKLIILDVEILKISSIVVSRGRSKGSIKEERAAWPVAHLSRRAGTAHRILPRRRGGPRVKLTSCQYRTRPGWGIPTMLLVYSHLYKKLQMLTNLGPGLVSDTNITVYTADTIFTWRWRWINRTFNGLRHNYPTTRISVVYAKRTQSREGLTEHSNKQRKTKSDDVRGTAVRGRGAFMKAEEDQITPEI